MPAPKGRPKPKGSGIKKGTKMLKTLQWEEFGRTVIEGNLPRVQAFFAETPEQLDDADGNYYEDEIYTQRFLPKWVYRGEDYTMVCVDTHTDGNQFLRIFDNLKERKAS